MTNYQDRLQITLAENSQIPDVAEFISLLLAEEGALESKTDLHKDALHQIKDNPLNGRIISATVDDVLVGVATLHFTISTVTAKRVCYIEDIIVKPNFRSSGIGTKIIEFAFSQAERDGCYKCSLHVGNMNERAKTLYEGLGFSVQEASLMSRVLACNQ